MVTYYLLHLPAFLLLLLIVGVFVVASVGITALFRKYIQPKPKTKYSEIMGHIYGLLGGVYGLLIGFVTVLVWGDYNDTQTNAAKEESAAVSLYQEIRFFPDSVKAVPLRRSYLAFVHSVIETEYPDMETLKPFSNRNEQYINEIYRQLELLNKSDTRSNKMVEHLDELAMYRTLRQSGAYADIPTVIWTPLLLGYLTLIVCALFLDIEGVRRHLLVNGLLGAFIGLMIYIILLVNHPFAGSMRIEPDLYKTIIQMEQKSN